MWGQKGEAEYGGVRKIDEVKHKVSQVMVERIDVKCGKVI